MAEADVAEFVEAEQSQRTRRGRRHQTTLPHRRPLRPPRPGAKWGCHTHSPANGVPHHLPSSVGTPAIDECASWPMRTLSLLGRARRDSGPAGLNWRPAGWGALSKDSLRSSRTMSAVTAISTTVSMHFVACVVLSASCHTFTRKWKMTAAAMLFRFLTHTQLMRMPKGITLM